MTNNEQAALPTLAEIRELIANRPRKVTLNDLARAANASPSWVKQVLSGQITDPAYNKIAAVYQLLKPVR